jgi:hypothetical protein
LIELHSVSCQPGAGLQDIEFAGNSQWRSLCDGQHAVHHANACFGLAGAMLEAADRRPDDVELLRTATIAMENALATERMLSPAV